MSDLDKLEQYLNSFLFGLSIAFEAATDKDIKNKIDGSIQAIYETLDRIKEIREGKN